MLTRRDVGIIIVSVCFTLGIVALVRPVDPIMGTTIFHFDDVDVDTTEAGLTRSYFRHATSTLLKLELRAETIEPGVSPHPPRPHESAGEQLILVTDGSLEIELGEVAETTAGGVEEKIQRLTPGSAVFLASNQWHALRNTGEQATTYYVFDWVSPGMMGER